MLTSSQFLPNQQRDNVKDAIAVTLEEDPLCPQIVEFLPENQAPVDNARGIAAWWAHCDELALVTASE